MVAAKDCEVSHRGKRLSGFMMSVGFCFLLDIKKKKKKMPHIGQVR